MTRLFCTLLSVAVMASPAGCSGPDEGEATQGDVVADAEVSVEPDVNIEPDVTIPLTSCAARCGVMDVEQPCQCDDGCVSRDDCCDDLCAVCGDSPNVPTACLPCEPDCGDRLCGDDGCGGSCGE